MRAANKMEAAEDQKQIAEEKLQILNFKIQMRNAVPKRTALPWIAAKTWSGWHGLQSVLFESGEIFGEAFRLQFLDRDEFHGGGVYAIAFAGGLRAVIEDVA